MRDLRLIRFNEFHSADLSGANPRVPKGLPLNSHVFDAYLSSHFGANTAFARSVSVVKYIALPLDQIPRGSGSFENRRSVSRYTLVARIYNPVCAALISIAIDRLFNDGDQSLVMSVIPASTTERSTTVIGFSESECDSIVDLLDQLDAAVSTALEDARARLLGELLQSYMGIDADLLASALLAIRTRVQPATIPTNFGKKTLLERASV